MAGSGLYDDKVEVRPEPELLDLIPIYIGRRNDDVASLQEALDLGDFERVRILGHSMKGSGGGYGFDGITEIGLRLEDAGGASDTDGAIVALDDLRSYLRNVVVLDV
jgi:HPt (histidine-containing phosphotransfer) domain-containing protein